MFESFRLSLRSMDVIQLVINLNVWAIECYGKLMESDCCKTYVTIRRYYPNEGHEFECISHRVLWTAHGIWLLQNDSESKNLNLRVTTKTTRTFPVPSREYSSRGLHLARKDFLRGYHLSQNGVCLFLHPSSHSTMDVRYFSPEKESMTFLTSDVG